MAKLGIREGLNFFLKKLHVSTIFCIFAKNKDIDYG